MSRLYLVTHKATDLPARYVRAHTLNGAIRAVASELFEARTASAEDIWEASKEPGFEVLDALNGGEDE
jgi:hypothetical protein